MKINPHKQFVAEFATEGGTNITEDIEADSLEDATIEATNIAEEKGYEFLAIDYANKNL